MINYFSLCMSKYMFVGSSCWKIFSLDMEFEGDRFFSLHILKFFFTLFFVLFLIWNLLSFSIWYVPPPCCFSDFLSITGFGKFHYDVPWYSLFVYFLMLRVHSASWILWEYKFWEILEKFTQHFFKYFLLSHILFLWGCQLYVSSITWGYFIGYWCFFSIFTFILCLFFSLWRVFNIISSRSLLVFY